MLNRCVEPRGQVLQGYELLQMEVSPVNVMYWFHRASLGCSVESVALRAGLDTYQHFSCAEIGMFPSPARLVELTRTTLIW